jgi:hypothetical protein
LLGFVCLNFPLLIASLSTTFEFLDKERTNAKGALEILAEGSRDVLLGLVWFGLIWFWFGLVWSGLVWFGFVWFGLVWFVLLIRWKSFVLL